MRIKPLIVENMNNNPTPTYQRGLEYSTSLTSQSPVLLLVPMEGAQEGVNVLTCAQGGCSPFQARFGPHSSDSGDHSPTGHHSAILLDLGGQHWRGDLPCLQFTGLYKRELRRKQKNTTSETQSGKKDAISSWCSF